MLPTALRETAVLMLWVGAVTSIVGLIAAWLVAHFEFPGRRIFEWALILPLAIPTYLAAYTYVEFLDFTGPIQQVVRALTGAQTFASTGSPTSRVRPAPPSSSRWCSTPMSTSRAAPSF
jgi:iron(III) transport system permease protein